MENDILHEYEVGEILEKYGNLFYIFIYIKLYTLLRHTKIKRITKVKMNSQILLSNFRLNF